MNLICFVILLSFGNFQETAWRTIHSRQVAHTQFTCLLCFLEAAPDGKALYRQATQAYNPLWVSLTNCLAVMNFRQATRVFLARFCASVHFRLFMIEEKVSFKLCRNTNIDSEKQWNSANMILGLEFGSFWMK